MGAATVFVAGSIYTQAGRRIGAVLLTYDRARPYEANMRFLLPGEPPNDWLIGRDLLIDGRTGLAGMGDVTVAPAPDDRVAVTLRTHNPREEDTVYVCDRVVHVFVVAMLSVVPRGAEAQVWDDAELRRLLDGAR